MSACSAEHSLRALCDAAGDGDPGVRGQAGRSLREMGQRRPELVMAACHDYLAKRSQLEDGHRAAVLHGMVEVAGDAGRRVGELLAKRVIAAAREELTRPEEAGRDASREALSDLLVALGRAFAEDVLEEMLRLFGPEAPPDVYAVRTVAHLSEVNVYSAMSYMPAVLEAALPLLNQAKSDRMKAAVASALGSFSRSILAYQEKLPDPTLRKEAFAQEIQAAYDVFFNAWLQLKDSSLRQEVLSALGDMAQVLPEEKLREELPRLLPGVLACYKRQAEARSVTCCLRRVLAAASGLGGRALEPQAEALLRSLYQQACGPCGPSSELLACFATVAGASPGPLLRFLAHKMAGGERGRVGALTVLRHLLGSCPAQLGGRRAAILSGLKPALSDASPRVRRAVLEAAEALVAGGYLEVNEVEGEEEEGGVAAVVEFVVAQCGLGPKAEEAELRSRAEQVLSQASAMVGLERALWPSLLGYVTPLRYTGALAPLCRTLDCLCSRRIKAGPEPLAFDSRPGLPSPQALLARLLAAASLPYEGGGRGVPALRLLLVLAPAIHPALDKPWRGELPDLTQFVAEASEETFPQQQWEKSLLLLLFKSLEAVSDAGWRRQLGEELTALVGAWQAAAASAHHALATRERQFLYKCLGIVLQHTSSGEDISHKLQEMLLSVHHHEALEREGAAVAVGFCAMTHLDETLTRLEDFAKPDAPKKMANFFNALMETLEGDVEKIKCTLILCYGYAALYAPEDLLLPRLESGILQHVINLSNTKVLGIKVESKDLMIRLSLIKAVTLIAKAVLANGHRHSFSFTRKGELLANMQNLIKAESRTQLRTPVRQLAMTACASLIKLGPSLNKAYVTELIKTCLDSVVGLQPPPGKGEGAEEKEREGLYEETLASLQGLLSEILLHDLSPDGLQAVFKHVEGWVISTKDHERERAMGITYKLTALYLEKMGAHGEMEFGHLGAMVGRLAPRCTDPVPGIRELAVASICALFDIHLQHRGLAQDQPDEMVEHLRILSSRLDCSDGQQLLQLCSHLARVISRHLPHDQVAPLLFALFEGLEDHFFGCSSTASAVMNTAILSCGSALQGRVAEILRALYVRLQWITGDRVRLSVIHFISVLASQNTAEVVYCLLLSPLPWDRNTTEIWRSLGGQTPLATSAMELLLEALVKQPSPQGERPGSPAPLCSALDPLAVICALKEMLSNPESAGAAAGLYPRLFGALLLQLGAEPSPAPIPGPKEWKLTRRPRQPPLDARSQAAEALRVALGAGGTPGVAVSLQASGGWDELRDPERHHQGAAALGRAMAEHARPRLAAVAQQLAGWLPAASTRAQRVSLTAFLGELLAQPTAARHLQLADVLLASLLGCLRDPAPLVRRLSLLGLANLADGDPAKAEMHSAQLLGALASGVRDADDPVKLEALAGLGRLLPLLKEGPVRGLLGGVVAAAQPLFEHGSERVRAAAFGLLGGLSCLAGGGREELRHVLAEQLHTSLVSLVLHIDDGDPEASRACRSALKQAGPLLGSEGLTLLLQSRLDVDSPPDYWDFLHGLCRVLVAEFPARVSVQLLVAVAFFRSLQPEVRANAVALAACLLHRLPRKYHRAASGGDLCADIADMLQDPVACVRASVARALALLH
ncbi:maestro heat-like repeat-containing protein family member 1 [Pristis pectinata]|uniref:maestro heat-like repeat-containing protein family member 1 n=1 Tax=Pristis pectinata TaxID=685728 RepID=UPI00223DD154|nr:maestro heat-like repeat-containing protein family member 1 [Pristis pectinata]